MRDRGSQEFIPHFAEEYGFKYELVTYKWPTWLRAQREKQRIIWAYKILFLDVLFPMDLDKVIFVDADQIVRTDLKELIDLDLHGAPYGYTPMGDDNEEMEGFRFWKTGYWAQFLRGRPYHIRCVLALEPRRKVAKHLGLVRFMSSTSFGSVRYVFDSMGPINCTYFTVYYVRRWRLEMFFECTIINYRQIPTHLPILIKVSQARLSIVNLTVITVCVDLPNNLQAQVPIVSLWSAVQAQDYADRTFLHSIPSPRTGFGYVHL